MAACREELPGPAGSTLAMVACGDSATLITVVGVDTETRWRCARRLAERLGPDRRRGLVGTVATYDSVLVEYDPVLVVFADIVAAVGTEAQAGSWLAEARPTRTFVIPVAYGGDFGPDLEELADFLGISQEDVIARHGAAPYVIRTVASPAGAPMTDGPDLPRAPSRLAVPRVAVPGGSVAVAGRQGIVYATPSPGGWRLIGRTPVTLFDPHSDPPVPYRPGDLVEYVRIEPERWSEYAGVRVGVRET